MFNTRNYLKVSVAVLIVFFLFPVSSFSDDNNTGLHFGLSSIFGAAAETFLHYKTDFETPGRIIGGTIIGSVPGFAKELSDNRFSGTDMAADVAGALIGSVIANYVNNKIQVDIEKDSRKIKVSLLYRF
jgi:hypothetical protein